MSADGLYGKCPSCHHVFLVARLPMEMHKAAKCAKRAYCAECGELDGIKVATGDAAKAIEAGGGK